MASPPSSFRTTFSGELIGPTDPGYDRARAVWNATADRRPALIARCASRADVSAAVRLARERDLVVAVRGGAHSYPGFSTCDGGVVVDLSPMRRVGVDAERRLAQVEGSALLGELDRAAQTVGLACPSGAISHTGVGGLTLGGGMGRLMRKHGLTIDNLIAVELVTADGGTVRASVDENPELFWGMRGAGSNFGIATAFEFRLHPIGPEVFAGSVVFPVERARELAAFFSEYVASASDAVTATLGFGIATDEPPFPPGLAGQVVVAIRATHAGDPAGAERELRRLREIGAIVDTFAPVSYLELQRSADEHYAWGKRNYWKGLLLTELAEQAIDMMVERLAEAPSASCAFDLMTLGGAVGRVPEDATAFSGRSAKLWLMIETQWLDPRDDERYFAWGRGSMDALRPLATSANYVNDLGSSDDLRSVYGAAKYERLVALKRSWDPENVFRLNQNIVP